jgi:hypothetical protein
MVKLYPLRILQVIWKGKGANVHLRMIVLWEISCSHGNEYKDYWDSSPWRWRQCTPMIRQSTYTRQHGSTSHKAIIFDCPLILYEGNKRCFLNSCAKGYGKWQFLNRKLLYKYNFVRLSFGHTNWMKMDNEVVESTQLLDYRLYYRWLIPIPGSTFSWDHLLHSKRSL